MTYFIIKLENMLFVLTFICLFALHLDIINGGRLSRLGMYNTQ